MAVCDTKLLVSGYHSIDMHCNVLPVKFDGGLSISFLRKKELFTKKGLHFQKSSNFQKHFKSRNLENGQIHPLGKSPTFLYLDLFCKRNRQPTIKFDVDLLVLFIYRLIPRTLGFRESIVFFDTTQISCFLELLLAFTAVYDTKVFASG
jgi:hypothetical protein